MEGESYYEYLEAIVMEWEDGPRMGHCGICGE